MNNKYHKIPLSRGISYRGRAVLDTMISLNWIFHGIEYNREKKVNEYLFKQKLSNNEKR